MNKFFAVSVFALSTLCTVAQVKKATPTKPVASNSSNASKAQATKASTATDDRNISITLTPYKNTWVYLGCYFGKNKTLSDSAFLNEKSYGVFKGKNKLTPGIYFIVSPQYAILFDILMDSKQKFSIVADTLRKEDAVITGSLENNLFKNYAAFSLVKGNATNHLKTAYGNATTKADSLKILNQITAISKEVKAYQNNVIKQNPNSLLAALFNALKQPETPPIPVVNGKPDSTYPFRYVKDHFWDDVNFNDDRLLRTPFFEPKLDNYFKNYVSPEPDSVYPEIKYMLLMARTGKEMYPYLLTKFTNKYINPEFMGQDRVFLKIFEDFYAKGDTTYLNPASRKTIIERAYSLMANQIGNQAPILDLTDTLGKTVPLYGIDAKFTFVVFWDPTCGHCKEEIPRIDSMYKAKWKALGVQVYSVNVNEPKMVEFKQFLAEKKISTDWAEVYQTKAARDAEQAANQPNFRQLYDMYKTPTYYLLDEKKRIIAKQLSLEQFDDVIAAKLKNK
ncbi:MAG: DUF5106 domain-containing protein [Flavobacterium sp.]|nr:DUF5106 domain-containing protein [Flavobacterium sp.]